MSELREYLSTVEKSKIHSTEIARALDWDHNFVKSQLLHLKKNAELDFEYLTGWVYFDRYSSKSLLYEHRIRMGWRFIILGIISFFFIPPLGLLFLFSGAFLLLQAKYNLTKEDGKEIDIVGAGVIMNALMF